MRTLFFVVTALATATLSSHSRQQSAVYMFRGGPAHTGVYSGGGATLDGLAWRAPTEGDVVSSPTIAGNIVYVGSNDGHVYALSLTTGERKWRSAIGSSVGSSPAVANGLVYVSALDGSITAVDAITGARAWRVATGPLLKFPWGHESGDYYLSSPAVVGEDVFVGGRDGLLYALNAKTGATKWKATTGGRIRSSPAVSGRSVFVGSFDGHVYAFDVATGKELWRHATEGTTLNSGDFGYDRRSVQSSPAVANGIVYVGARDGFLYAIDAATGKRKWRFDHQISWVNSSPAVADGIAYAGSSDGHFLQAVDSTGKELWRTNLDGLIWSSAAVAGPLVYVGDGIGRVHALDRMTGEKKWTFRTGASVYSSPAVSENLVVVGSSDGHVYAIHATNNATVQRVVYFDSTLVRVSRIAEAAANARYLAPRGYAQIDSSGIAAFLRARVADKAPSVVVFTMDAVPSSLLNGAPSLLRQYLDAGGKVVWMGPPPTLFPAQMPAGKIELDWKSASAITGVPQDSALFDRHGVRATAAGTAAGLPLRWRDAWSVAPAGVTTVLGLDDTGLAAAYIKNFGGPKGTGFVRVPSDDPFALYLIAEYRPG